MPNLIQFNAILVLSHWPVIVEGTLHHHPLHFVAHAVLLTSAILMWFPIVSPLPEVCGAVSIATTEQEMPKARAA